MIRRLLLAFCLLPTLALAQPFPGHPYNYSTAMLSLKATNGMRDYWKLDETSGTAATDLGGDAKNGVYNGGFTLSNPGALGDGSNDFSVAFNGSTGYVSVASMVQGPAITNGVFFSIASWFNQTASATENILSQGVIGGSFTNANYSLAITNTQQVVIETYDSCNTNNANVSSAASQFNADGTWYFVAFTASGNGTGIDFNIYLNASNIKSQTLTRSLCGTPYALTLGRRFDNVRYLHGAVDDTATFNTILSQNQITWLYEMGKHSHSGASYQVKRDPMSPLQWYMKGADPRELKQFAWGDELRWTAAQ